jgi:hypothetical protein
MNRRSFLRWFGIAPVHGEYDRAADIENIRRRQTPEPEMRAEIWETVRLSNPDNPTQFIDITRTCGYRLADGRTIMLDLGPPR